VILKTFCPMERKISVVKSEFIPSTFKEIITIRVFEGELLTNGNSLPIKKIFKK
jgi:hypothetical protein